jgi:undecaprenyl-diphosphatase
MLDFLENIDTQISLFINSLNCPALDFFMYHITHFYCSVVVYVIVVVLFIVIKRKRGWVDVLFLLLALAFVIIIIACFIKPHVARLRPCHTPEIQGFLHIVRGYTANSYSFLSSHAATSFIIAVFVCLSLRKKYISVFILLWAFLYSYSRIYLGVHFFGDVLCGALLGTICAKAMRWIQLRMRC